MQPCMTQFRRERNWTRVSPARPKGEPQGCGESLRSQLGRWSRLPLYIACLWLLSSCTLFHQNQLETVLRNGELTVLTYVGATTYYETPEGPAGFEYDLAKAFADYLNVDLRIVIAPRFADLMPRLANGEADFAAGLTITNARRNQVRFTNPYQEIRQQVVYRLNSPRPTKIEDLIGREIEVNSGTSYVDRLAELKQIYPQLKWTESQERQTDHLLQMVWEGLLDLTVADSNIVALNSQYFPELQVAFDLHKPEPLAWAFAQGLDKSLYDVAMRFLGEQRQSGVLAQLIDRYYGPAGRSNFVNLTVYRLRVQNRLPNYQQLLEQAAKRHRLDWRLLAATGYQESYWDPTVISPTGVRGFMMLTKETADELGVNRLDPAASIEGGARYLRHLIDRMPERIQDPDRRWFALAAYNVGINHVEDARILTQKQGADPDKWNDVKERLPLLSQPRYYSKAKFGFCRGIEPVRYVNRIRTYFDVLAKLDEDEKAQNLTHALKLKAPAL